MELDSILIEPEGKNTAPAILAATLFALAQDKDSIILVSPSDHVINDERDFHKLIKIGLEEVKNKKIVTFGVVPTRPETGYGYLRVEKSENSVAKKVGGFIEKPSKDLAEKLLKDKQCLWNSGIFLLEQKICLMHLKSMRVKS